MQRASQQHLPRPLAHLKCPRPTNGQLLLLTKPLRVNLPIVNVSREPDMSNAIQGEPKKDSTQWNYSRAPISDDVNPQSYAHAYLLILLHLNTELILGPMSRYGTNMSYSRALHHYSISRQSHDVCRTSRNKYLPNKPPNQMLHLSINEVLQITKDQDKIHSPR